MKLYEKLPQESEQSWEAFVCYRNLDVERSTAKVGQRLGKSKALMDRWSSRNNWVERATAWDIEQQRLKDEAAKKAMAKATEEAAYKQEITAQRILNEQANLAFGRITNVIRWKDIPGIVDSDQLSDEDAAAIESVEFGVTEEGKKFVKKINFYNKQPALTKLGETKKLWGTKEDPTQQNNFYAMFIEGIKNGELEAAIRRKGIITDESSTAVKG